MALKHEQSQSQIDAEFAAKRQAAYDSARRSWELKAQFDENTFRLQQYLKWKREQEQLAQETALPLAA